ncbi:hypothetical protein [Thermomonas sp. HDW16]|uniref:hypothetical protein n=1 Tax=Thermomonas sp. HDW16 TaxID=2714945 RepID=UPI0014086402|nr:hypothetical protein [Thermomonas sp. HDW16]QIL19965.1 hypothetical protein G7079_04035 [Thermomonas sp. HDW16]
MKRIMFGLVVMLAVGGAPAQERAHGWIGKAVPPYPEGVEQQQGSCIGDGAGGGPERICHHMVSVVFDPQSKLRTLLVVQELPHFGKNSIGIVTDAFEPEELDDAAWQVSVGACQQTGQDDGRIVAIVKPHDVEWLGARRAWRVDGEGRMQTLPAKGVRCRNEGYGYDG